MKKGVMLGVFFSLVLVVVFALSLSGVSAAVDCTSINLSSFNELANAVAGQSVNYTSIFYQKPVNFSIKIWTEDLNYNITCYNFSGVSYQSIYGAPSYSQYDTNSDVTYHDTSCIANKIYLYLREGGGAPSDYLGYNISYVAEECTINCACAGTPQCLSGRTDGTNYCNGCDYIYNNTCSINITSASWKKGNTIVVLENVTAQVNVTVNGTSLLGQNINFSIYNSANTLVYSKNISAQNANYAYLNWTAQTEGSYYFNATLISTSKTLTSGNIQFSKNVQTRSVKCNGTLPANASWVDGVGNFTQSKDNLNPSWSPESANASYNLNGFYNGECLFNCNFSFEWNGSSCLKLVAPIVYCSDYASEYACEHDLFNVANDSVSSSSICGKTVSANINGQNCYNETNCGCVWKNGNCSGGFTSDYFCEGNPIPTPYGECYWTTSVVDKCDSSEAAVILTGTALWNSIPSGSNAPLDPECIDYIRSLPCVSKAELPAFSLFNIVFAFLGIVVVYFLFGRKFR
jgi:hypothetical protein